MAKGILSFFGGLSILAGIVIISEGLMSRNDIARGISLAWGCTFLIAGAPLLGFARVIVLLEQIARNTTPIEKPGASAASPPASVEEMVARTAKRAVGR